MTQKNPRARVKKLSVVHREFLSIILTHYTVHGEWPTVRAISDVLCRAHRETRNVTDTMIRYGLLTEHLENKQTPRGTRLARVFTVTLAGRELMNGTEQKTAERVARETARRKVSEAQVQRDVCDAVREWYEIMNEWPTRNEVVQMVEEHEAAVTLAQLRKLIKLGEVSLLLFVDPVTKRQTTRLRVMKRVASVIAA